MAGRRDRYIYELYDNKTDKLFMRGLAKNIAKKLNINQNRLYITYIKGGALFDKYYVERIDIYG